jgi:hypothetical protein
MTASAHHETKGRQWLRLGVLQNGRLLEERLVPAGSEVSVGTSHRCTVVLAGDEVGRQWRLFARQRLLRLAPGMEARIAVASVVRSVAADPAGGTRVVPLLPSTRGRITVGDLTILFQLQAPPPVRPRPRLPASVRGSLRDRIDRWFGAIALVSLVCHVALVLYLRAVDWPRAVDAAAVPERWVHDPPALRRRLPPAPAQAPPASVRPMRAEASRRPPPRETTEDRRRRLVEQVKRLGLLNIVGALGPPTHVANLLRAGEVDREQEEVLRDLGGVTTASAEMLRGLTLRDTAPTGRVARVGDLRALDVGDIATAVDVGPARERRIEPVVRVEAPEVADGTADDSAVAAIAREIRARMSAVRGCYERALRRNPQLGGKLTLRIAISPAGTVTAVDVDDETGGDSELGTCLRALLLRWRFAAPGGALEISFPFVFQPVD